MPSVGFNPFAFDARCVRHVLRSTLFVALSAAAVPQKELVAQIVRGEVHDESTGRPIVGARLVLLGEGIRQAGHTGADGRFQIAAPVPGEYRLRCEMPGYRFKVSGPIRLGPGQEVEQIFRLTPLPPMTLDTVLVAGERIPAHLIDFYRRRASGLGAQFLTREEFERWSPSEVTHIVQRLSGFMVRRINCFAQGSREICRRGLRWTIESRRGQRCPPLLVVDGVSVGTTEDHDLNDLLWVENLDAVEAYTSAASLPPDLNATGSACGVLVFWTRR